ncbi:MAG: DUF1080 domain-containing protein [Acidobacteria bacterium]|nr:DUF1080 domain-containing protein [Acidobacteriota bacterium]
MTRRSLIGSLAAPLAAPALQAQAFEPLFDGQTLRGWTVVDGPASAFYVNDGAIVVHEGSGDPTWLRTDKAYENFEFRCEVFIKGWANGGLFFHAPLHGRPTECGVKLNLFQKKDSTPLAESIGAVFPVIAPRKVNVRNQGEWNAIRVLADGPAFRVWINDELVQDLNRDLHPALRHRLRSGYIGIQSLSYPLRFRKLEIRELTPKEQWTTLYSEPADLAKWTVIQSPKIEALGDVLRTDNLGYLATKQTYKDFEFQCYIRASRHSNGGIIFRSVSEKSDEHYEIQLHDVEGAVYPTGSLYGFARCRPYPRIEPEVWYPFQLIVKGQQCVVRVNGDTVVDYANLLKMDRGPIMLQAHQMGKWVEYKQIRVREI